MDDEELKGLIGSLRRDLVKQINDGNESVLNRLSAVEAEIQNLDTIARTTRNMILNVPKTMVEALEEGFLQRIARIEADVRKLKGE
jgi:hypothetical protein